MGSSSGQRTCKCAVGDVGTNAGHFRPFQAIELDCQSSMSERLELLRPGFADVDGIIQPVLSFNGIQRDIQSSSAHILVDSAYSM